MRCVCCNKNLSDKESTRKGVNSGEYLDMCDGCFSTVAEEFPYIEGHGKGPNGTEEYDDGDGFDADDWEGR